MPKWLQIEVEDGEQGETESQVRELPDDRAIDEVAGYPTESSRRKKGPGRLILGLVALVAVAGLGLVFGQLMRSGGWSIVPGAGNGDADAHGGLAYVDGVPITTAELDTEYAVQLVLRERIGGQVLTGPEAEAQFRRELVDRLVDRRLVLNDAAANNIVVSEADLAAQMPTIGSNFNMDTEELRAAVFARQPSVDEAAWRNWAAQQVLLGQYVSSEHAQQLAMESLRTLGRSQDPVSAIAALLFDRSDVRFVIDGVETAAAREGNPAPDFTLPAPDGTTMKLSDFRGKPVMINFWATWCAPCRIEMPLFVNAYETNKDDLVILGVNSQERPDQVVPYVQGAGLTFPIVIDDGTVSAIYRVRALPTTFFVDAEGMLVRAHRGAIRSRPELKPFIEEIFPSVQLGLAALDPLAMLTSSPRSMFGSLR